MKTIMAVLFAGVILGAQIPRQGRQKLLSELESETPNVRAAASAEVLSHRQPGDVAAIMRIVEKYVAEGNRQGTVKDAMMLLGKLRAIEAVPLLVRNITFQAFYKNTKRPQPPEDQFPAVAALIEIGEPSLRPVLERLAKEDGEELQLAGTSVLRGVLGKDGAQALLAKGASILTDEQAKARIKSAIALIDRLP